MEYTVIISCIAIIEADNLENAYTVANEISKDISKLVEDTLVFETEVSTVYEIDKGD